MKKRTTKRDNPHVSKKTELLCHLEVTLQEAGKIRRQISRLTTSAAFSDYSKAF